MSRFISIGAFRHSRSRHLMLATIATLGLLAAGCATGTEKPVVANADWNTTAVDDSTYPPVGPGEMPSKTWSRADYYRFVVKWMTNPERMAFFKLDSDFKRDLYLREIGADARLDSNVLLQAGMAPGGAKGIFKEETWESYPVYIGNVEEWTCRRFNGRGYTAITVSFVDDSLAAWRSFAEQRTIDEEQIIAECNRIEKDLRKILRVGLPMSAMKKYVENALKSIGETLAVLNDKSKFADAREDWTNSQHRAQYEMQLVPYLLLATKANPGTDPKAEPLKAYALKFKEPNDTRYEGQRVVWRYDMPFGDRKINLFLVFVDRELQSWYAEPELLR